MENSTIGLNVSSLSATSTNPYNPALTTGNDNDVSLEICIEDRFVSPAYSLSRERESVKLDLLEVIDTGEVSVDGPAGMPAVSVIVRKKPDWIECGYAYDAVVLRIADGKRSCRDGFNCIVSDCCGSMLTVSNPYLDKLGITVGSTIILSKDNIITIASVL